MLPNDNSVLMLPAFLSCLDSTLITRTPRFFFAPRA